jgi:hypothetical protein
LVSLAMLGEWVDVDLWHYETADGRSIRKAVDFMLPYVKTPSEKWPYQQIVPLNRSELAPVFRAAALACNDPRYEAIAISFLNSECASFQLLQPVLPGARGQAGSSAAGEKSKSLSDH